MKKSIPLKEYVGFLKAYANVPLSLNRITLPFGVITGSQESKSILVGHILDDLVHRYSIEGSIDIIDVVTSAHDLGHEQAEDFLDQAAQFIYELTKDQGLYGAH
jgi:hypothetical protein